MVFQHYNINCAVNIAPKVNCYISKSKLALSECNEGYLSAIAFMVFMLHEIKQGILFWDTRYIRYKNKAWQGYLGALQYFSLSIGQGKDSKDCK